MFRITPSLGIRWLALVSLVSVLLILALEPNDTAAVKAFRRGVQLTTGHSAAQIPDHSAINIFRSSRQGAVAAYRQVIARRPLDPQPWRRLAYLKTVWGQPDDALYAYGQALHRGDDAATLDRGLARLYAILGDSRETVRRLTRYLARRPDDRSARLTLAQVSIQLADWERARTELELLLSDEPEDPKGHAWLGLLLIGTDPAAGFSHLERAAEESALSEFLQPVFIAEQLSKATLDPSYRSALLGAAFLDLDIASFLQSYAVDPFERAPDVQATLKRTTATLALRSLLASIYSNPGYADAYAYLGQALDQLGRSTWALASLRHALELNPQSAVAQTLTGLHWDRHGSPGLARRYYEAAYHLDPDNTALCLEIAASYAAEGEYTAAETWLLNAVRIAPDNPWVWQMLTRFYLDYGIDVEESGLSAATELLELVPDDARAHDLMGWAYFLSHKDEPAEASLNQALMLDPTLASAHYHLGRLHARQHHYAEASQEYRRAADFDIESRLLKELERAWDELPPDYTAGP